jgi:hypothetical protein
MKKLTEYMLPFGFGWLFFKAAKKQATQNKKTEAGTGTGTSENSAANNAVLPLGIRNNNPGNIRYNGIDWRGATGRNRGFVVFVSPEYGIRALTKVLSRYYHVYRLRTIEQIINRYAPTVENNTQAYINSVARRTGFGPTEILPWPEALPLLIDAIIKHENGIQPYDTATIMAGIRKAGEFV